MCSSVKAARDIFGRKADHGHQIYAHRFVLESLIRFGAPESIRYDAKPHIGTDVLVRVVQNLRRESSPWAAKCALVIR
jgi:uncharacterized FAD-dependent dehydrogenase